MSQNLVFQQRSQFSHPESPLLRLLRQHGLRPESRVSPPLLGRRQQLIFRRSASPESMELSESLMGAFRRAKADALAALAPL